MDEQKSTYWKFVRWFLAIILAGFVLLILGVAVYRIPAVTERQKTEEQVAKIHATKLTLDDVLGKNLPPAPDQLLVDATIAGIDANSNGIRDDVELAIFAEYPDSAKTRAVLLQYALALQMEATQEIVNSGVVGEVANKQDRAIFCIAKIIPMGGEGGVITAMEKYGSFIFNKQFNTEERETAHKDFYSELNSGRIDDSVSCDIELSSLSD